MFTKDRYIKLADPIQVTVDGKDYVITQGNKGFYIFALGALIPSMIPGRAVGPERYAECLNKTSKRTYGNQYRRWYRTYPYNSIDEAMQAIWSDKDKAIRNNPYCDKFK